MSVVAGSPRETQTLPLPGYQYRPEIDGIRALAVVCVIVNHFDKGLLPGGYLGVDIFFVISGYVITSSLLQKKSLGFAGFIGGFYLRRIRRLLPALAFFIVVMSVVLCLFNPEPKALLDMGLNGLIGTANISLYQSSTDYFAQSTQFNPFTHTWSLGVEEQFYLVFPFLIWFTGCASQLKSGARNLVVLLFAFGAASMAGFVWLYPIDQSAAYYLMPFRFWELAAGCALCVGFQKKVRIEQALERVPPCLVLITMVVVMCLPMVWAVPATIAVVMLSAVLIACLKPGTGAYALLTSRPIVYIGLISYSLYLWHWGVLAVSRVTIGVSLWTAPLQIALMLAAAVLSYEFIEKPLRRGTVFESRMLSSVAWFAAFVVAVLFPVVLKNQGRNQLFLGARANLKAVGTPSLTSAYKIAGAPGQWLGEDCVLSSDAEVGAAFDLEKCTLGDFARSRRRILVIGNSYSASFVEAFDDLVRRNGFSVTLTSSWGASPVREIPNLTPWSKADRYYWDVVLPGLFKQLKRGDIVFAVNDLSDFGPKAATDQSRVALVRLEMGLARLSRDLGQRGVRLFVMHALPFAREAQCSPDMAIRQWYEPWGNSLKCQIPDKADSRLRLDGLNQVLRRLESQGAIKVVDVFDVFCPRDACDYFGQDGSVLYRDEWSHPSVEGARLSADLIRSAMQQ